MSRYLVFKVNTKIKSQISLVFLLNKKKTDYIKWLEEIKTAREFVCKK